MYLGKHIGLAIATAACSAVAQAQPGAALPTAPSEPAAAVAPAAATEAAAGTAAGADLALFFGGLGAIGFVTLRRGRSDG